MSGLFVKLDAEYATDDKLIAAGPLAELLYVRGLAFSKRQMVDGLIKTNQLPAVGIGIPSPAKHAAKLVEVGAWEVTKDGWVITGWLKRNKSAAAIIEDKALRARASAEANHAQHHVGPGKKKSLKCEICREESGPKSAPKSEDNRLRSGLQEPEPEPEPEEEPEEESEPEEEEEVSSSSLSTHLALVPPVDKPDDDDYQRQCDYREVLDLVVAARCSGRHINNLRAYRASVEGEANELDGELIRRMLADGTPTDQVALFVLGQGFAATSERVANSIPWCGSDCPTCGGDAWVDVGDGLAPCPNRIGATA